MNGLMKRWTRVNGEAWVSRAVLVGSVAEHSMYGDMSTRTLLESSISVGSSEEVRSGGCAGQNHAESSHKHRQHSHYWQRTQATFGKSEQGRNKVNVSTEPLGASSSTPLSCKAAQGST